LQVPPNSVVVKKGHNPNVDSYSAFFDNKKVAQTELEGHLRSFGITDCYLCGIAYDVCVGATAAHSLEVGFRTILVDNASRGIETTAMNKTRENVRENHGVIVDSSEVH
jgi:nicotinamidase-related amidase